MRFAAVTSARRLVVAGYRSVRERPHPHDRSSSPALALVVGGAVAGITAATSDKPPAPRPPAPTVRAGAPPLSLDLGVRVDREAVDLREALRLYEAGKRARGRASSSPGTTRSRRGSASRSARWPDGTVARLTQLSGLHPKSAAVQLNLGIARFWAGEGGAEDAWKSAASTRARHGLRGHRRQPAPSGLRAQPADLRPVDGGARRRSASSPRPHSSPLLERRARTGTIADRLFYGVALQRLGKQLSAERVYAAAAEARAEGPRGTGGGGRRALRQGPARRRRSPGSGRSRATFPKAATVRFHLGLLLLWSGQVKEARRQLELVRTVEPGSPLVGVAERYLDELRKAGI